MGTSNFAALNGADDYYVLDSEAIDNDDIAYGISLVAENKGLDFVKTKWDIPEVNDSNYPASVIGALWKNRKDENGISVDVGAVVFVRYGNYNGAVLDFKPVVIIDDGPSFAEDIEFWWTKDEDKLFDELEYAIRAKNDTIDEDEADIARRKLFNQIESDIEDISNFLNDTFRKIVGVQEVVSSEEEENYEESNNMKL